jgi:hypothetical protein
MLLKPKKFSKYFLIVLSIPLLITGCKEGTSNSDYDNGSDLPVIENSEVPIYPGADNLNKFSMKNGKIEGIKYEVNERYPDGKVLAFYEAEMKHLNYVPYIEEDYKDSDRKWQRFIDTTKEGSPYVAQLMADWVNSKRTKLVKLILNYYWKGYDGSSKIVLSKNKGLIVTVQIMPF